jgi:hypothetical protein
VSAAIVSGIASIGASAQSGTGGGELRRRVSARLQKCVLGALTFGEERQRLPRDERLEMLTRLVGDEGGVIHEKFIE